MRWTIESKATGGLKVISEIPDITPCLIEGRNGVGKTVAIHLLQLASGKIPQDFVDKPDLWPSMKARLGQTRVVGTELQGANQISLTFTPLDWPDALPSDVDDWLGTCEVDGESVDLSALRALVSVEHISGTEDLSDTLDRHRTTLEGQLQNTAEILRTRTAQILEFAEDLIQDLERADPAEVDRETNLVVQGEREVAERLVEAQAAAGQLRTLLHASETKRKRDALDTDNEQLLSQRTELLARTVALEADLEKAENEAEKLSAAVAAEGEVGKQLAAAQRLLRTRTTRAANVRRDVDKSSLALDVEGDEEQLADALVACARDMEALGDRLGSLDTTGELRSLIDQMLPPVRSAVDHLGSQTLAAGFSPEFTVTAALDGLEATRRTIANQPAPAEVRELNDALGKLVARRNALDAFAGQLAQLRRDEQLKAEAEVDYELLQAQVEAATANGDASRAAHQAVGAIEQELGSAHAELASLQQAISSRGMVSREDADDDIHQAELDLGIAAEDWDANEMPLRQASAAADENLAVAERALAQSRRRLLSKQTEMADVAQRIRGDSRYSWLLDNQSDSEHAMSIEAYPRARQAVIFAIRRLEDAENLLVTLQGLSRSALDPQAEESALLASSRHLIRPFRAVLGARLTETLNRDAIRQRVFDGAEVKGIDPAARTVTLATSTDEVVRPLSSFSTGERAFAFTQARIADIEPSSKPNKLLFLDEFGAYVSADRLPDLAEFLASEVLKPIADQVIVILPLHVDYETEVENTRGTLRDRYLERLDQIGRLGYCAVALQ